MKFLTQIIFFTFFGIMLFGFQVAEPTDWKSVFDQIKKEVEKNSKAYETLKYSTEKIGHRLTGSKNGKLAEDHAFQLLKSYGFDQVSYQPFQVKAWARDQVSLSIAPKKSDNFVDIQVVSLAMTPVEAHISGEIIDLGNGLEEDFEKKKTILPGKIALMNIGLVDAPKGSKNLHRSEKTALAIQYGATGVLFVNTVPGHVLLTGTASVTSELIRIPAVCMAWEDGQELRNWLAEPNTLIAEIEMKNTSDLINARNVIARLEGTDPALKKEKIIIGGHLDSWDLAQGAIDNGIGSYSVIDIARTFKSLHLKTKRTIEFVLFMGEEEGLLGSKAYLKNLLENKQENTVAFMINLDMTNDTYGFNAGGREEMAGIIKDIGNTIKSIDENYENSFANAAGLHSDHQSFMMEGIPVGWPQGKLEPHVGNCYHANCDSFNLVSEEGLKKNVKYTAMYLYALANLEKFPAKKLNFGETREFLIKQNLKRELELGNEWKWE